MQKGATVSVSTAREWLTFKEIKVKYNRRRYTFQVENSTPDGKCFYHSIASTLDKLKKFDGTWTHAKVRADISNMVAAVLANGQDPKKWTNPFHRELLEKAIDTASGAKLKDPEARQQRIELYEQQHDTGWLIPSNFAYMRDDWGTSTELFLASALYGLPAFYIQQGRYAQEFLDCRSFMTASQFTRAIVEGMPSLTDIRLFAWIDIVFYGAQYEISNGITVAPKLFVRPDEAPVGLNRTTLHPDRLIHEGIYLLWCNWAHPITSGLLSDHAKSKEGDNQHFVPMYLPTCRPERAEVANEVPALWTLTPSSNSYRLPPFTSFIPTTFDTDAQVLLLGILPEQTRVVPRYKVDKYEKRYRSCRNEKDEPRAGLAYLYRAAKALYQEWSVRLWVVEYEEETKEVNLIRAFDMQPVPRLGTRADADLWEFETRYGNHRHTFHPSFPNMSEHKQRDVFIGMYKPIHTPDADHVTYTHLFPAEQCLLVRLDAEVVGPEGQSAGKMSIPIAKFHAANAQEMKKVNAVLEGVNNSRQFNNTTDTIFITNTIASVSDILRQEPLMNAHGKRIRYVRDAILSPEASPSLRGTGMLWDPLPLFNVAGKGNPYIGTVQTVRFVNWSCVPFDGCDANHCVMRKEQHGDVGEWGSERKVRDILQDRDEQTIRSIANVNTDKIPWEQRWCILPRIVETRPSTDIDAYARVRDFRVVWTKECNDQFPNKKKWAKLFNGGEPYGNERVTNNTKYKLHVRRKLPTIRSFLEQLGITDLYRVMGVQPKYPGKEVVTAAPLVATADIVDLWGENYDALFNISQALLEFYRKCHMEKESMELLRVLTPIFNLYKSSE